MYDSRTLSIIYFTLQIALLHTYSFYILYKYLITVKTLHYIITILQSKERVYSNNIEYNIIRLFQLRQKACWKRIAYFQIGFQVFQMFVEIISFTITAK